MKKLLILSLAILTTFETKASTWSCRHEVEKWLNVGLVLRPEGGLIAYANDGYESTNYMKCRLASESILCAGHWIGYKEDMAIISFKETSQGSLTVTLNRSALRDHEKVTIECKKEEEGL